MSAKHTPGPWSAVEGGHVYAPDLTLVAVAQHGREKEANARLIAAAPELLALLKDWRESFGADCHDELATLTDAAIAKATGEQP